MLDLKVPGTALIMSAHLDDAVLSCGGTLSILNRNGWRTIVATVCTEAATHPAAASAARFNCANADSAAKGLAVRRAEDRKAAAELGYVPVHLGMADASFRSHYDHPELGFAVFEDVTLAAADPDRDLVEERTIDAIASSQPTVIFAPLAVGSHVDHLVVRDACARAANRVGLADALIWYQDLPYAALAKDARAAEALIPAGWKESPITFTPMDLERKLVAVGSYASQVAFLEPSGRWREMLSSWSAGVSCKGPAEVTWHRAFGDTDGPTSSTSRG